jgi:hypothetical protein
MASGSVPITKLFARSAALRHALSASLPLRSSAIPRHLDDSCGTKLPCALTSDGFFSTSPNLGDCPSWVGTIEYTQATRHGRLSECPQWSRRAAARRGLFLIGRCELRIDVDRHKNEPRAVQRPRGSVEVGASLGSSVRTAGGVGGWDAARMGRIKITPLVLSA